MDDHDRLLLEIADRRYLVPSSMAWQRVNLLLDDELALRAEPERVLRLRWIRAELVRCRAC